MGWWRAGRDGSSLHAEETGLVWGDGPADIMDNAIDQIVAEFRADYGRKPSQDELKAGLLFSLGAYEETEAEPVKLLTSDHMEVRENCYLQDGRTLYKVSTVDPGVVTLIVCLENGQTPPRTTVRPLSRGRVAQMTSASDRLVDQYHAILDAGKRSGS